MQSQHNKSNYFTHALIIFRCTYLFKLLQQNSENTLVLISLMDMFWYIIAGAKFRSSWVVSKTRNGVTGNAVTRFTNNRVAVHL